MVRLAVFKKTDSSQYMEKLLSGRKREIPEGEKPLRTQSVDWGKEGNLDCRGNRQSVKSK